VVYLGVAVLARPVLLRALSLRCPYSLHSTTILFYSDSTHIHVEQLFLLPYLEMPKKQETQKSSRLERVKLIGRNALKSLKSRSSSPQPPPRDPASSSSAQEQNPSDSSHVVLPTSSALISSIQNPYSTNTIVITSSLSLMPPTTPPLPSNVRSEQESQQRSDQQPPSQPTSTPTSNPYGVDVSQSATSPPTNLQKVKAGGAVVFEGLKTTLRALKESSDAFPPLKAAVGGLLACIDMVEVRDRSI
jgi:hypothetical protein